MDNREFAEKLERRTRQFAVSVIRLSTALPRTPEALVVKNQLTKSGTSVGANYREANRPRSRADFISRIRICESEASETLYWLEIVQEVGWIPQDKAGAVYQECSELLAIFTSISKK